MIRNQLAYAILAGGDGLRLGGDKAIRPLAGRPMIAHVAEALGAQSAHLAVVGDRRAADLLGATPLADADDLPKGPVRGLAAALDWAAARNADWLLLAPCDTPLLPRDLAERLHAGVGSAPCACVETGDGLEPLISLWRPHLAAAVRAACAAGAHPALHRLLGSLGAARVALPADWMAMNVNTAADLAHAEARLA